MNLELDETKLTQKLMLEQGSHYEQEISDLMKHLLTKQDVFIDCGAHVGFFTCLGAELAGWVYSFEAERHNYKNLVRNLKINKYKNITPYFNVVGDKNEECKLRINIDNDGGHALWDVSKHPFNKKTRNEPEKYQKQDMVKLDSIIEHSVKLIKIDVEGCELKVLKGAERLLKQYSPAVICEINDSALHEMGTTKGEIYNYMSSLGYQGFNLTSGQGWETLNPLHCDNAVFVRINGR
jgi:FkbM family methyltransferase